MTKFISKDKMNNLKNNKLHLFYYYGTLLIISLLCFYFYSNNINLKIAYGGFGPHNYVNQKLYPENYQKNFLGTAMAGFFEKSIVMKSFYSAKAWFGIEPEIFVYPFMLMQCLIFIFSLAFLIKTLFNDDKYTLIGVLILSLSRVAGENLSTFGGAGIITALSVPLYYSYAYAFTFIAISFSIRKQYVCTFLFLSMTVLTHITMGMFACVFIGTYFLFNPKEVLQKNFLIGLLIFIILIGHHVLNIMQVSNINTGEVSAIEWIKATKMFTYHWYPLTMRMFTTRAHIEFLPIMLSLFAFFISLSALDITSEKIKKIIAGVISCIIISIIGIICVEIFEIPILIKISLQRSTCLVSFFGVIFYSYYLYKQLHEKNFLLIAIAAFALITLTIVRPGISLLPMMLFLLFDIKRKKLFGFNLTNKSSKKTFWICSYLIGFVIIIVITNIFTNKLSSAIWYPFKYFNPFTSYDLSLIGGHNSLRKGLQIIIFLCFIVIFIGWSNKYLSKKAKQLQSYFFISLLILFLGYSLNNSYSTYRSAKIAKSYLECQLWAKNNTSIDALFMQDPTHSYAWGDFSQRSSFGTYRDWGYCSIAYDTDKKLFEEGKKRIKEFGLDLDTITMEEIDNYKTFPYYFVFNSKVRNNYYNKTPQEFYNLSKKYGITHIVMQKLHVGNEQKKKMELSFIKSYENKDYLVFARNMSQ